MKLEPLPPYLSLALWALCGMGWIISIVAASVGGVIFYGAWACALDLLGQRS